MFISNSLRRRLTSAPNWIIILYAALVSFGVYFCMYAFRKPFTAAGFERFSFGHVCYKIWLVTAQVIGYVLSKFYGIKFISGMKEEYRSRTILLLLLTSWQMLLFFAVISPPYNIIF